MPARSSCRALTACRISGRLLTVVIQRIAGAKVLRFSDFPQLSPNANSQQNCVGARKKSAAKTRLRMMRARSHEPRFGLGVFLRQYTPRAAPMRLERPAPGQAFTPRDFAGGTLDDRLLRLVCAAPFIQMPVDILDHDNRTVTQRSNKIRNEACRTLIDWS